VKAILPAVVVLAALVAPPANAAPEVPAAAAVKLSAGGGKSFLDHARTTYAEEPSYSVPATFPGPLVAAPRREPDTPWMLAACFGLLLYLGFRRGQALGAAF
jgi:hypothetical protein